AGERDVLGRSVAVRLREEPDAPKHVDGELVSVARADPGVATVGRETDVVGEEGRPEAPYEARPGPMRDVDDGDLLGLRAERDPERPAARIDADVAGTCADHLSSQDPAAQNVERDHLTTTGV